MRYRRAGFKPNSEGKRTTECHGLEDLRDSLPRPTICHHANTWFCARMNVFSSSDQGLVCAGFAPVDCIKIASMGLCGGFRDS